ncbi:hypothetical protein KO527_05265 [Pseudoalteromonas sp. C2R02]|uniref:hypothetical protein n=1 Tax=Pseudoalteromonas sp. C2R02 TaxID=2841565 RepID=UPI001C0A6645|nr:hypothetical protein [Pseudoalteromonas sp. C2R02]MBU2968757.1 hypothetical protein [Pseudoalteromonas sp. C2R02]
MAKAPTKKAIVQAVCTKFNIKPEYLNIDKDDGFYYWTGFAACMLDGSCTYIKYLSDWTLDRWVADFESKLEEWQEYRDEGERDMNTEIEKINWDIDNTDEPEVIVLSYSKDWSVPDE